MRLWSLHPKYLDTKGLTALWREALLARKVLMMQTKGYKNHPQLIRFRNTTDPIATINTYLQTILDESIVRGYNFDKSKITHTYDTPKMEVTAGQLQYELEHLKLKLHIRNIAAYRRLEGMTTIASNPMFYIIDGKIESWEIIKMKKIHH